MTARNPIIQKRADMDLLARSNVAIVVYSIIIPAIFGPMGFYEHPLAWVITVFIWCVCVLRILHRVLTPRFYDRSPKLWIRLFSVMSLIHGGVLGGVFALVLIKPEFGAGFTVMVIVIAGMASGSLSSLSPNLPLALLYPQVLIIPGIVGSLYGGHSIAQTTVMGIYLAYLSVLAVVTNKEYMRTFSIEAELEKQKKELEALSRTDALTGIFNRGYFNSLYEMQWETSLRNNTGLTMMMMDIDHFKRINDHYGHPSGDECIKQVAQVISQLLKRKTDISCRFGGEEFASLLGGTPVHEAEMLAEQIREEVAGMIIEYGEFKFQVTVSIGIANTLPNIGDPPQLLIEQTDQALYRAKKGGRNCIRSFH